MRLFWPRALSFSFFLLTAVSQAESAPSTRKIESVKWLQHLVSKAQARTTAYTDDELPDVISDIEKIFAESLAEQGNQKEQDGQPLFALLVRAPGHSPALEHLKTLFRMRYFKVLWSVISLSKQSWVEKLKRDAFALYDQKNFDRCERIKSSQHKDPTSQPVSDGRFQVCDLDQDLRVALAEKYGESLMDARGQTSVWSFHERTIFQVRAAYFRDEGVLAIDFSENILSNLLSFVHETIHATDTRTVLAHQEIIKTLPSVIHILKKYDLKELAERLLKRFEEGSYSSEEDRTLSPGELEELRQILTAKSDKPGKDAVLPAMTPVEIETLKSFFKNYFASTTGQEVRAYYLSILLYRELSSPSCFQSLLPEELYLKDRADLVASGSSNFSDLRKVVEILVAMEGQDQFFDRLTPTPYLAAVVAIRNSGIHNSMEEQILEVKEIEKGLPTCLKEISTAKDQSSLIPWLKTGFLIVSQSANQKVVEQALKDIHAIASYLKTKTSQFYVNASGGFSIYEVSALDDLAFNSLETFRKTYKREFNDSIPEWLLIKKIIPEIQATTLQVLRLDVQTEELFRALSTQIETEALASVRNEIEATRDLLPLIDAHASALLTALESAGDREAQDRLKPVVQYIQRYMKEAKSVKRLPEFAAEVSRTQMDRRRVENLRKIGEAEIRRRMHGGDYIEAVYIDENEKIIPSSKITRTFEEIKAGKPRTFSVVRYNLNWKTGVFIFDTLNRGVAVGAFIDAYGVGVQFSNGMKIYLKLFDPSQKTVRYKLTQKSGISAEYTVFVQNIKDHYPNSLPVLQDITASTKQSGYPSSITVYFEE